MRRRAFVSRGIRSPPHAGGRIFGDPNLHTHAVNLLVRTNRVRTAKKQACEKWTLTLFAQEIPVMVNKFRDLRNIFPVNLRRE